MTRSVNYEAIWRDAVDLITIIAAIHSVVLRGLVWHLMHEDKSNPFVDLYKNHCDEMCQKAMMGVAGLLLAIVVIMLFASALLTCLRTSDVVHLLRLYFMVVYYYETCVLACALYGASRLLHWDRYSARLEVGEHED